MSKRRTRLLRGLAKRLVSIFSFGSLYPHTRAFERR
jgi:hypothetical protein